MPRRVSRRTRTARFMQVSKSPTSRPPPRAAPRSWSRKAHSGTFPATCALASGMETRAAGPPWASVSTWNFLSNVECPIALEPR
jgi:hypothetical protein